MTICPIALTIGCKRCFAFAVCPLKTLLGDQGKASKAPAKAPAVKAKPKRKARNSRGGQ